MSACKCFDETLDKVREKLTANRVPEGSVDVSINWKGYSFFFSGDYVPVNPEIEIEFRKPKVGGGHAKNFTRDSISILCNYCPFCGRKLEKAGKESES